MQWTTAFSAVTPLALAVQLPLRWL